MNPFIIFVNSPTFIDETRSSENLGIGYLAASLPDNISYEYIDAKIKSSSIDDLVIIIIEKAPSIIAISCNYYCDVPSMVKLVNVLRNKGFSGHITIGGHGAVSCKEKIIKYLDINSLCLSEGEECLPKLVNAIKENIDYYSIDGFWFRKEDSIIKNKMSIILDLNILPFAIRFNEDEILKNNFIYLSTSRGCPFNCKFCDIIEFNNGTGWRMRSVENILEEIIQLKLKYGIKHFHFTDDNFIGSCKIGRNRANDFANEIIKRQMDITFSFESRVQDIEFELFRLLKLAGLTKVNLGVESASQRMLDTFNKNIKVEDSKQAIKILNQLNIKYHVNYILYDMYTTINEIEMSYNFFKEFRIFETNESPLSLFSNYLGIFSGTQFKKELEEKGLLRNFYDKTWSKEMLEICDQYHPIYSYEIKDNIMNKFIAYQEKWVSLLTKRYFKGGELSSGNIYEKLPYLYMKLFKKSIDMAKDELINLNEGLYEIENLINKYGY